VRRSRRDAKALTAYRVRFEHDGSATAMSAGTDGEYARSVLPAPSASKCKAERPPAACEHSPFAQERNRSKNPSAGGHACWSAVRRKQERFGGKRTALGWTLRLAPPSSRGKVRRGVLVHQIGSGRAIGLPCQAWPLRACLSVGYDCGRDGDSCRDAAQCVTMTRAVTHRWGIRRAPTLGVGLRQGPCGRNTNRAKALEVDF
jgi:hypothetical protein